jgi:hypothetical protein
MAGKVHELAKALYHADTYELQRRPTAEAANGHVAIACQLASSAPPHLSFILQYPPTYLLTLLTR